MNEEKGSAFFPCCLGWLLPGAGHFYLGRRGSGLIIAVAVLGLFLIGISIGGQLYGLDPGRPLVLLGAAANLGSGPVALVAKWKGYGTGDVQGSTYEFGSTFALVAGLLNILAILDVFEIASGRKV